VQGVLQAHRQVLIDAAWRGQSGTSSGLWFIYTGPAALSRGLCALHRRAKGGVGQVATVEVVEADLSRSEHQSATAELVDLYARDPMGDGEPLSADVRVRLIPGLREHPTTMVFLALSDGEPVGLAICFLGFSTFAAKPLINIHDFFVAPSCRGLGMGRQLLEAVAEKGRAMGCCKLTLEVLENNHRARGLYAASGFAQVTYLPEAGGAIFMSKAL
jgi:GNAT superfamily N-acetyltransferase